ncbi:MAG: acetyl-CoA carboxylase biotin carboxylase subunit [Acidobacteria bacterium]|nr:acetyl-CoA carboxylase biotin carboxylase subunit [Acidobacteriota bacterium]
MSNPPFRKILIANRGEIAVRVMRACREMGIGTVAVYSDVDRTSRHVMEADEAYHLGAAAPRASYLNGEKILQAAGRAGAQAIHPGYGFLSENAGFAETVAEAGLVFIGPPAAAIRDMGNKVEARRIMRAAGVQVTPGSDGVVQGEDEIKRVAKQVGYPVLLKAVAGGGGKGMRVVNAESEISSALRAVQSEAGSSFGDPSVFVERFVTSSRHIEVQILAGPDGRAMHLGERECSIQRRHQKLVEESPSPAVNEELRAHLGAMAVRAAEAVGYRNAGTVEFIMDTTGDVYFMEMNTRLQVEHPVTEMVTGLDLVRAQILVAAGRDPGFGQKDVRLTGAAIECRIFAEDPGNQFLPSPGRLVSYVPPGGPGVREDSGVYSGWTVPMEYDPLIAKLITWGRDRDTALDRMRRALGDYRIDGVRTTVPFHRALMDHPAFRAGEFNTGFLDTHTLDLAGDESAEEQRVALAAALIAAHDRRLRLAGESRRHGPMNRWKWASLREGLTRRLPGGGET